MSYMSEISIICMEFKSAIDDLMHEDRIITHDQAKAIAWEQFKDDALAVEAKDMIFDAVDNNAVEWDDDIDSF